MEWLRHLDRIPWQIIAVSGVLGFLVLCRYVQIQLAKS